MRYVVVKNGYELNKPEDMTVFASYSTELGDKEALRFAKDALRRHKKGAILRQTNEGWSVVQDSLK
jgi:hypothetical protein